MFARVRAVVVRFFASPAVQSVIRHAVTAAIGVVVATIAAGLPVTTAVLVVAFVAAARVVWVAVEAHFVAA